MAKLKQHLPCNPAALGTIETNQSWAISHKTTKPLQAMKSAMSQGRVKLAAAHYREKHSAKSARQPGGVTQIMMKPMSNHVDSADSDKLG